MDQKMTKELMAKLRQPIHINYISRYILKKPEDECKDILDKFIDDGIIEESDISKNYYVVKNKK